MKCIKKMNEIGNEGENLSLLVFEMEGNLGERTLAGTLSAPTGSSPVFGELNLCRIFTMAEQERVPSLGFV